MRIDSYLVSLMLVLASTTVAALGPLAVRRRIAPARLLEIREVAGHHLSFIGTMYAVLLGLIVVDAMSRFQQAGVEAEAEANALANLVLLSEQMPPPQRTRVQELAIAYARRVIDEEWPELAHGRTLPEARLQALALLRAVRDWEPATPSQEAAYSAGLASAEELWNNRRRRSLACVRGIPTLFWIVVLVGGTVCIILTCFLVLEDLQLQIGLTALVTLIIGLNVLLLLFFGYPFSGDVKIAPDSFRVVLEVFDLIKQPTLTSSA